MTWMRGDQLDQDTVRSLRDTLLANLFVQDTDGFRAPFSALVLAEVARTDRLKPWLSSGEREDLVSAATRYLPSVTDYRAFSDAEGWRHGVAHGADLILQLGLNTQVSKAQLERLLAAIAVQVAPAVNVSYRAGESDRLARPVLFIARRRVLAEADWSAWFGRLVLPAPFASWDSALRSELGLAKRHNTRAFLLSLYASARDADDPGVDTMLPALQSALKTVAP